MERKIEFLFESMIIRNIFDTFQETDVIEYRGQHVLLNGQKVYYELSNWLRAKEIRVDSWSNSQPRLIWTRPTRKNDDVRDIFLNHAADGHLLPPKFDKHYRLGLSINSDTLFYDHNYVLIDKPIDEVLSLTRRRLIDALVQPKRINCGKVLGYKLFFLVAELKIFGWNTIDNRAV